MRFHVYGAGPKADGTVFRSTDSAADALAHYFAAQRKYGVAMVTLKGLEIGEDRLRRLIIDEGLEND